MPRIQRLRRTQLYMPGDDLHKIQKGATLNADSLILDIEDGVALNRKAEARATIREALSSVDFGRAERLVRINPANSGLEADDLPTDLPARPRAIGLPHVQRPEEMHGPGGGIAAVGRISRCPRVW